MLRQINPLGAVARAGRASDGPGGGSKRRRRGRERAGFAGSCRRNGPSPSLGESKERGFLAGTSRARTAAEEPLGRRLWHRLPWLALGLLGAMA
jgi:hypothetical protein